MKKMKYVLYFRTFTKTGEIESESITKYKFKELKEAKDKQAILNGGLGLSGKNDKMYVIAKVTTEYI